MPHISQHDYQLQQPTLNTSKHQHSHSKHNLLGKGNEISTKNLKSSSKNILLSPRQKLSSNYQKETSIQKAQSNVNKSLSKKLFQKAKIISDPKKQTFLSPQHKNEYLDSHKPAAQLTSTKNNLQKGQNAVLSPRKEYEVAKKVSTSSKNLAMLSSKSTSKGSQKLGSLTKRTNKDPCMKKLDQHDDYLLQQNKQLNAKDEKKLLCDLKNKLQNISSIQNRKSYDDHDDVQNDSCLNVFSKINPQVQRIQSSGHKHSGGDVLKQKQRKVNTDTKQAGMLAKQTCKVPLDQKTFSQLVMQDDYIERKQKGLMSPRYKKTESSKQNNSAKAKK